MYFNHKRCSFNAFDGKNILLAQIDCPSDGDGLRYKYLYLYSSRCQDFLSEKLFNEIKEIYLSQYNDRHNFNRYYYELNMCETYDEDGISSYLITVILKCGTNVVSSYIDSVVFYEELIIPPKIICPKRRMREAVILDPDGIPARAKFSAGTLETEQVSKRKFTLY